MLLTIYVKIRTFVVKCRNLFLSILLALSTYMNINDCLLVMSKSIIINSIIIKHKRINSNIQNINKLKMRQRPQSAMPLGRTSKLTTKVNLGGGIYANMPYNSQILSESRLNQSRHPITGIISTPQTPRRIREDMKIYLESGELEITDENIKEFRFMADLFKIEELSDIQIGTRKRGEGSKGRPQQRAVRRNRDETQGLIGMGNNQAISGLLEVRNPVVVVLENEFGFGMGVLRINILCARGLLLDDMETFSPPPSAYVVLNIDGQKIFQTNVIQSSDPNWKTTYDIPLDLKNKVNYIYIYIYT